MQWGGMIWDESHYIKGARARRTQAARKLTRDLAPGDLLMMLTGTPILNRPQELIQPLLMLGVLSDAPGALNSPAWFDARYCRTDDNLEELARFLRSTCMLRRTKDQVLTDLPAKQRVPMWVELSAQAQAEFDARARDAVRNGRLVGRLRMQDYEMLRHAVSSAKARDALPWAREFLDSTSRPLVIFAHYQATQRYLIDGLTNAGHNVTHLLGSQNDVEAHKARFQSGESDVIVCSLMAAGTGHTLTAASDVLMIDQDWRPGIHWQAEDRCDRIGQANAVTAWYMLAENTVIDDYMFRVVGRKAGVFNTAINGAAEQDIASDLLTNLSARYAAD